MCPHVPKCPHGNKAKRNCKECQREWRRIWTEKNREKDKEFKRKYNLKHSKKLVEKQRVYRKNNPEKMKVHNFVNHHKHKLPLASKCELCPNTEKLERHHPDYDYPEIYVTVCRFCHRWIEKNKEFK